MSRTPSRRASSEGGFVLIAAVLILLVLLLLSGAAVSATVAGRGGSTRSTNSTRALQAANAAANVGWEATNLVQPTASQCPVSTGAALSTTSLASGSWCPANTVPVPGADTALYYVSTPSSGVRYVVGVATVGSATRRVQLMVTGTTTGSSTPLFQGFGLISLASITLGNSYYVSGAGVRSNGSITLDGTGAACHVSGGAITPGVGGSVQIVNNASTCGNPTTAATSQLSPSAVAVPTTDDDARICGTLDPCTAQSTNDVNGDAATKTLSIGNQGVVTLTGNTYVFCSLTMTGGTLNVNPANGRAAAIYFLAPGTGGCPASTTTPLSITNGAVVNNQTELGAGGLAIYVTGSTSSATTVTINNNSQINAAIWAPNSLVQIQNQGGIKGAVAGKAVTFGGNNPYVVYDSTVGTVTGATGTGRTIFAQTQFIDCTSVVPTAAAPAANCPG